LKFGHLANIALWDAYLLALCIVCGRLSTILHEFGGHVLPAAILGLCPAAVQVSLFGGGFVLFERWPQGLAAGWMVKMGGILLNVILGGVALGASSRMRARWEMRTAVYVFGALSLLGGLAYWTLGSYFEVGDPVHWARSGAEARWASSQWIALFPIAVLGSYFCGKELLRLAGLPGREEGPRWRRLFLMAGTVIPVLAGYGTLFLLSGDSLAAADAPRLAREKAEREAFDRERQRIAGERGVAPEEIPPQDVVVDQDPVRPSLAFFFIFWMGVLIGGVWGALRAPLREGSPSRRIGGRTLVMAWAAAAGALGAVALWLREGIVIRDL